jgi:hypothetical protein
MYKNLLILLWSSSFASFVSAATKYWLTYRVTPMASAGQGPLFPACLHDPVADACDPSSAHVPVAACATSLQFGIPRRCFSFLEKVQDTMP